MHIRSVYIKNFRAIRQLELTDLPNAIVVAGPNGCGKSSFFDAIRLLKSAYGQYNPNEYQSFFQEFQINVQRLNQEGHRFFMILNNLYISKQSLN
jgi:AAA15 family ATPase/GTPase